MPVYDDEQQKTGISDAELRSITGVQPGEEQAMEREAYNGAADDIAQKSLTPSELKDAENSADKPKTSSSDVKESDSLPSEDGGFFKDKSGSKGKFRVTKKQGIIGGIVGLLVGGGFGLMSILQGPLQIIHVAQLLQNFHFASNEQSSSSRIGRLYEYAKTSGADGDRTLRNVGFLAGKLSDKYLNELSQNGIEPDFTRDDGTPDRRLQGLRVDPDSPQGKATIDRLRAQGFEVPDDGNIRFTGSDGAPIRREALKIAAELPDKGKVSSAISKRLLIRRAGVDFHPLRNVRRDKSQSIREYFRQRQQESAEKNQTGDDPLDGRRLEGTADVDEDGNIIDGSDTSADANDGNQFIDEAADAVTPEAKQNLVGRFLKGAGVATAVVGALCVVRDVSNSIDTYQQANIVLPMLRMSMEVVTVGSQIMTGQDLNIEEVGAVADTFYDEETQSSLMAARGMQAVAGQDLTGPDSEIKPSDANEKPVFFEVVDGMGSVLGGVCGLQNAIGNLPILKQIGEASSEAVSGIIKAVSGKSLEDYMESLISFFAGDIVDTNARGAERGNYIAIGGRLAANDAAIAMGGGRLAPEQAHEMRELQRQDTQNEFNQKSFFAKAFDLTDSKSVGATAIIGAPNLNDANSMVANFALLPQSILSNIGNTFNWLNPSVTAQSNEGYDFGVDAYGFSFSELENEEYADPYTVASRVEPRLDELNEKYSKCFGTAINPQTFDLIKNDSPTYKDIQEWEECNEDSGDLKNYRFYLLDTITIRSMACYEGLDDKSCAELGIEGESNTRVAGTDNIPVVGNTADTPCYPGTNDIGTTDGYSNGERYTIRLCEIPGFPSSGSEDSNGLVRVNSTASENWLKLVQAAQSDQLQLRANSSFRSNEEQTRLYNCYINQNCNGGNKAAAPGTSNHQMGIAVDIDIVPNAEDPSLTQCQSNPSGYPTYQWLAENAGTWGFSAAIASECWHWSTTGR